MKIVDQLHNPTGTLHLIAYDSVGVEVWRHTEHNLIVDTGYNVAAEALAGVPGARIDKVAVGTNGAEPNTSDTQIADPFHTSIQSVEYPTPTTVRFNFTFGYGDAVGMSIREFGLLTEDGRLFSRKVRQPIEKTVHMSLVGAWDINF